MTLIIMMSYTEMNHKSTHSMLSITVSWFHNRMKEKNKIVIMALIQLKKVTPLKRIVMTEMMIMMMVAMRRRKMIVIKMTILVTTVMSKLRILAMITERKM